MYTGTGTGQSGTVSSTLSFAPSPGYGEVEHFHDSPTQASKQFGSSALSLADEEESYISEMDHYSNPNNRSNRNKRGHQHDGDSNSMFSEEKFNYNLDDGNAGNGSGIYPENDYGDYGDGREDLSVAMSEISHLYNNNSSNSSIGNNKTSKNAPNLFQHPLFNPTLSISGESALSFDLNSYIEGSEDLQSLSKALNDSEYSIKDMKRRVWRRTKVLGELKE